MLLNGIGFLWNCVKRSSSTSKMDPSNLIKSLMMCIPLLNRESHKGQAGRIGIIGGSLEYTGAPYFAGISALKVGADLVHIFCSSSAGVVIKSYSPELIVHPILDKPDAVKEITPWLDRLHAVVIGPGLGRNPETFKVVSDLIKVMKTKKLPLIVDADGLFLITENPDLIKDYPSPGVILTPNKIEFERLKQKINNGVDGNIDLTVFGEHVTLLKKGASDDFISSDLNSHWTSDVSGSGRRCGGQGDLLSGSVATFLHWTLSNKGVCQNSTTAASLASYAGSRLVRLCNEKAFKAKGRSMLTTDMIEYIHEAFEELFDE